MADTSTIQIRIDPKLKAEVKKINEPIGFDISSLVKVFLNQVRVRKAVPFTILTENGYTPEFEAELDEAIKESEDIIKNPHKYKAYTSGKELISDILDKK